MSDSGAREGTGALPADLGRGLELGGETGQLIANRDWSSHPLGPMSEWSPTRRALVTTALSSRFPIVLWLGDELSIVYNDAYIPMLGAKHPDALGRAGRDVWWEIWDVIGPMLEGVVSSEVATWSDDQLFMLFRDGYREEAYFTFTYSPIVEADGSVGGVFCAVNETTERVLGERRLEALRDMAAQLSDPPSVASAADAALKCAEHHAADVRFLAVYLHTGDGAVLHGATSNIAGSASAVARLLEGWGSIDLGSAGTTLIRETPHALRPLPMRPGELPSSQAVVLPLVDAAGATAMGRLVVGLNPHRRFDKAYRAFCELLAGQVEIAFVGAVARQHERERAESLAELDRAKTAFFSNVSHEFRTPLTLMLGPLEELSTQTAPADHGLHERVEMIERNARRLLRLVNSLLDFSRVESGRTSASFTETDIGEYTADLASSFRAACEQAGIDLDIEYEPVVAYVDRGMWETIVLNLLSNAFKFTFEGTIEVRVAAAAHEAVVTVDDTGVGIRAEDIPRLFERFYRAAASRGRSFEGSGIGLSLVRELAELHGGSVEVTSAVDRGTAVTVRIPLGSAHLDQERIEPTTAAFSNDADAYAAEALQWIETADREPAAVDARPSILVVDDNADMRRYLRHMLSPRWHVRTAARGEHALEMSRQERPDLIVTDVMMPSMDGFELVSEVRADPSLGDVPIIVLSARAGDGAAVEGLERGADDYLIKPFSAPELIERVSANLRSAERANEANRLVDHHEQRARVYNTLSSRLADTKTIGETLAALVEAGALLDDAKLSLAILDRRRALIRLYHSAPLPTDILERNHNQPLDGDMPYALAIRTNDTVRVEDWRHESRFPSMVADSVRAGLLSGMAVPLRDVSGDAFGAVGFAWNAPRAFTDREIADADEIAVMAARTIERIRHTQRDHEIATALQDELLDVDLRSTAGVACTRYVASTEMLRVGGDWYTATSLGDGRIGVSVGDVVGTGVRAAAVMSQLRSALTAAALADDDPAAVLDIVNRHAATLQGAEGTTAAYAVIDPERRIVSYACAGHPYPILVEPNGVVRYLPDGRGGPLGIDDTSTYRAGACAFEPGALLMLYTDGLIERRGESLDDGLERLRARAEAYVRLPANVASDSIIEALAPPDGYRDDIALVAVRLVGTTPKGFVDAIEARPEHYVDGRHRLRAWLSALGTEPQTQHDVLVAVGEAVMNAIDHGGRHLGASHVVTTEAFVDNGRLLVTVNDCGQWDGDTTRSRRLDSRGRGLTLMYGLMDHVEIHRTRKGTQVVMEHMLDRERVER